MPASVLWLQLKLTPHPMRLKLIYFLVPLLFWGELFAEDSSALAYRKRLTTIALDNNFDEALATASDEVVFESIDFELFTYERFLVSGGDYNLIRERVRRNLVFLSFMLRNDPRLSLPLALTICYRIGLWLEIDSGHVVGLLNPIDSQRSALIGAMHRVATGQTFSDTLNAPDIYCFDRFNAGRAEGAKLAGKKAVTETPPPR